MDSGLDAPLMVDAQADEGPSPWIATGPAHLLFWAVLVWPVVAGRFGQGGFDLSTQWIRPVAAWLTSLLLALAALRSLRRAGLKEGRGLAIATLALFGLLAFPILALAVLMLLFATQSIRL